MCHPDRWPSRSPSGRGHAALTDAAGRIAAVGTEECGAAMDTVRGHVLETCPRVAGSDRGEEVSLHVRSADTMARDLLALEHGERNVSNNSCEPLHGTCKRS